MGRSSRFTFEEKTKAVKAIISGESSINYQAALLNCNVSTVRKWVVKYKTFGFNGLKHIDKNKIYNIYTKVMAVKDYLSSDKSLEAIVIEYKIHEKEQLRNWVSLYNKGKLIKSGGLDSMRIKGTRKNLTLENRIEICKLAQSQQNSDIQQQMVDQLSDMINQLPENSISVKEKWKAVIVLIKKQFNDFYRTQICHMRLRHYHLMLRLYLQPRLL